MNNIYMNRYKSHDGPHGASRDRTVQVWTAWCKYGPHGASISTMAMRSVAVSALFSTLRPSSNCNFWMHGSRKTRWAYKPSQT